jgi:polyphosphate glucokinase
MLRTIMRRSQKTSWWSSGVWKKVHIVEILGIDIGGTGIKGAPVDTVTGALLGERFRLLTPAPATPAAVSASVAEVVSHFAWHGPIGCGFPAVIRAGQVRTAVHVDKGGIGCQAGQLFQEATGCPVTVLNDADAAGYAEMRFGAGQGRHGVVFIVTLGTGIGTALFVDGCLVPNTELGHIEIRGKDAERRAAASVRENKDLSWKKWARRVDEYLQHINYYLWPDLIIVGGGVSTKADKFLPLLTVKTEVVAAQLENGAGIVGAALAALYRQSAADESVGPTAPDTAQDMSQDDTSDDTSS